MFYDRATILVKGGDGGKGAISFRHEKYVPRGGPDGGDGGNGGSVILIGDPNIDSLLDFSSRQLFRAPSGEPGKKKLCYGAKGRNLKIGVPLGTIAWLEEGKSMMGEVLFADQELIVARGGQGGRGNAHFATPVDQAPRRADSGMPGEERELVLELKLIADIGLVGLPNAGKSSLIRSLTNATPKIGAYPFTTTRPHLGVLYMDDYRKLAIADLPGLVEGAHKGRGLGLHFLRHIERCSMLIVVIDVARREGGDPADDYQIVMAELGERSADLPQRVKLIAANKMDLPEAVEGLEILKTCVTDNEIQPISALTGQGIIDLINRIKSMVNGERGDDAQSEL